MPLLSRHTEHVRSKVTMVTDTGPSVASPSVACTVMILRGKQWGRGGREWREEGEEEERSGRKEECRDGIEEVEGKGRSSWLAVSHLGVKSGSFPATALSKMLSILV